MNRGDGKTKTGKQEWRRAPGDRRAHRGWSVSLPLPVGGGGGGTAGKSRLRCSHQTSRGNNETTFNEASVCSSHLLEHGLVVIHIVHSDDDLSRGRQGLRAARGVVIRGCNIQDIFNTLEARWGAGAQPDQACKQT